NTPADVGVELEVRLAGKEAEGLREQKLTIPARLWKPGNPDKEEPPEDTPGEGVVTFDLDDVDDAADVELHARLTGVRDQFPLDDEAWLVAGVVRKARVLIVTPGNAILRDFFDLEETAKVADVRYLTPADLKD